MNDNVNPTQPNNQPQNTNRKKNSGADIIGNRTEKLFYSAPIPFLIIGYDGEIKFANKKWRELFFDRKQRSVPGNITEYFFNKKNGTKLTEILSKLSPGSQNSITERIDFRSLGNQRLTFDVSIRPSTIDRYEENSLHVVFQDITEQEKFREAYINLVEHSFQAVLVLQDLKIVFANKKAAEITGYTVEELVNMSSAQVRKLIHPEDRVRLLNILKRSLKGERVSPKQEFKGFKKDGSIYWLEILATIMTFNGRPAMQIVQIDVSEKKKAEDASKAAEDRFKKLVEQSLFGIYIIFQNRFTYVNPRFAEIFGYDQNEIVNKLGPKDLVHEEDRSIVSESLRSKIEGIVENDISVFRGRRKDGTIIVVEVRGSKSELDGQPAIIGTLLDITQQREIEETLILQSEALGAAANGILITDKAGKILYVNPAFTNLTGYDMNDLYDKDPSILKSDKHDKPFYNKLWNTILDGTVWKGEMINKRKDGSTYIEEQTITPVTNENEEITHFIAIKNDITLRKKAELALKEREEKFRGLYENSLLGIYRTTPDGEILMANPSLLNLLGYDSLEEFKQLTADKALYDNVETRELFQERMNEKGDLYGFESTAVKKDGTKIYIRESARAVKDENGKVIFYEGTVEDISSSKDAEKALISAKDEAEKSDKLKSEFLAQMSHEIRTPINVILSFSNLIRDEVKDFLSQDLVNSFAIIDNAARRTMRTIDLMLNMSQIQTGSYEIKKQNLDIYFDVLHDLGLEFTKLAEDKNLSFKLVKHTDDTFVTADDYSIRQVFDNLIHNAIKYTHKGEIVTRVYKEDGSVCVDVEDTGIGISEEYIVNLFEPFTQEDQGYTRKYEGNGLGLALVKKYCEMNGCDISVKSRKGVGTTFTVTFPS